MSRWILGGGTAASVAGLAVYAVTQSSLVGAIPGEREQFFEQKIKEAQELNRKNQPAQAIQRTVGIPTNSKHFTTAQKLQEALSQQLLDQARTQHRQGNIDQAIATLQAIPSTTKAASESQQVKKTWLKEKAQLQAIRDATAKGDWTQAIALLEGLRNSDLFNSPEAQSLFQQAVSRSGSVSAVTTTPPTPLPVPVAQIPSQIPVLDPTPIPPADAAIAVNVDQALRETAQVLDASPVATSIPIVSPNQATTTPTTNAAAVSVVRELPPSPPAIATVPMLATPQATTTPSASTPISPATAVTSTPEAVQSEIAVPKIPAATAQPDSIADSLQPTEPLESIPPIESRILTTVSPVTTAYESRSPQEVKPAVERDDLSVDPLPATEIEEMLNASTPKTSQRPMQTANDRLLTEMQRRLSKMPVAPDTSLSAKIPRLGTSAAIMNKFAEPDDLMLIVAP